MTTRTLAHYQFPIDRIREVEAAARAMLAALDKVRWIVEMAVDDDRFADELKAIDDAIAAAKAAGIKAEG
jgi:hypothetical protein